MRIETACFEGTLFLLRTQSHRKRLREDLHACRVDVAPEIGIGTCEICWLGEGASVGALQLKNIRGSGSFSDSGKDRQ